MRHGLLPALRLKVIEDSGDDVGIVDAGNDPNRTPAMLADFDIDSEHPLETPCPSHGAVFFGSGHWLVGSASLAAPGRCDLGAPAAVGGEDSMEASEVDPGSWHQRMPMKKCDQPPHRLSAIMTRRALRGFLRERFSLNR